MQVSVMQVISSSGMYGAESVILSLCRSMTDGYKCRLAVFHNSSNPNLELYEQARREGVETYQIPCKSQLDRRALAYLRALVSQTHANVVHAHGYKADIYAYLALRGTGIPLISTCHTWYDNDVIVYLYGVLDRLVLRSYTHVVAVSEDVKSRLRRAGVRERQVQLIRNGIDLKRFTTKSLSESPHPPIIGLVGRLAPEKGVDVFLRAAAIVLPQFPEAQFVVAGDGPHRAGLEALVEELGIGKNASLWGRCDDMADVYHSFDLMVSASRQEGLPIAILEGMANGLPIIATAVGEVPNIIRNGKTGVLLSPDNPELLASAIMNLLSDTEARRTLGSAARNLVERDYSRERMTSGYLRIYKDALRPTARALLLNPPESLEEEVTKPVTTPLHNLPSSRGRYTQMQASVIEDTYRARPLRFLVEFGSYPLHNHGDNAMMQVAVERIHELFPQAEISVVMRRPDRLARLCPTARPIDEQSRHAWLSGRSLIGGLHRVLPHSSTLLERERRLWLEYPHFCNLGTNLKAIILGRDTIGSFYKELTTTDYLVVCGMGLINDAFKDSALDLLDELHAARLSGCEVVAFGQGIGPITTPELQARAKEVLPKLKLIAIRESNGSLKLLESFGVPRDSIFITGDDAIERAYNERGDGIGTMIGVNVRVAGYAATGEAYLAHLRPALFHASECLGARLTPLPISFSQESSDSTAISSLLDGHSTPLIEDPESLDELLYATSFCRVVVTGSYHAGVFALSQGIPVIALVQSSYYEQKFSGLRDQFAGIGCSIIDFRHPVNSDQIAEAIIRAWNSAESVRDRLLSAAAEQVARSRAAYAAISDPAGLGTSWRPRSEQEALRT
jgi:glycosyltransferase involved in cell wall biosynthesis/polysaccharide pyruvyl transferase WcaK-like protein